MSKLILATSNLGKIFELRSLLSPLKIELITPSDYELHLSIPEVGSTYAENAAIKSMAYYDEVKFPVIADDTGLEVDALDGAPGLFSARYSPKKFADDEDRRQFLLENLKDIPQPWMARFYCAMAIADYQGQVSHFSGICEGEIIPQERGSFGFGYDPIFYIPQFKKTMAELTMEEKNRVSHRADAVKLAIPYIETIMGEKTIA